MPDPPKPTLCATYTSPSSAQTFTNPISAPLPSPETPTAVKDKVTYLSELRASTKRLQEEINVFLTQKMEEDKASSAGVTGKEGPEPGKEKDVEKSKDELMEENYGEEEEGDEEG